MKKYIVPGIAGAIITGIFWFIYTGNGDIVSSIGLTVAMCVAIGITLKMMDKSKNRN